MTENFFEGSGPRPDQEKPTPATIQIVRNLAEEVLGEDAQGHMLSGRTALSARRNSLRGRGTSLLLISRVPDYDDESPLMGRQIKIQRDAITRAIVPCVRENNGGFFARGNGIHAVAATQADLLNFLADSHDVVPIIRTQEERDADRRLIKGLEKQINRILGDYPQMHNQEAVASWMTKNGDAVTLTESDLDELITIEQRSGTINREYVIDRKYQSVSVAEQKDGQESYGESSRWTSTDRELLQELLAR